MQIIFSIKSFVYLKTKNIHSNKELCESNNYSINTLRVFNLAYEFDFRNYKSNKLIKSAKFAVFEDLAQN